MRTGAKHKLSAWLDSELDPVLVLHGITSYTKVPFQPPPYLCRKRNPNGGPGQSRSKIYTYKIKWDLREGPHWPRGKDGLRGVTEGLSNSV